MPVPFFGLLLDESGGRLVIQWPEDISDEDKQWARDYLREHKQEALAEIRAQRAAMESPKEYPQVQCLKCPYWQGYKAIGRYWRGRCVLNGQDTQATAWCTVPKWQAE